MTIKFRPYVFLMFSVIVLLACKKESTGPAAKEYGWKVNARLQRPDAMHDYRPSYASVQAFKIVGADTAMLEIDFNRYPDPGLYSIVNFIEDSIYYAAPKYAHIRLDNAGNIYRNYGLPAKKLTIGDSAGYRIMTLAGIWLHNEQDRDDSLQLTARITGANNGNAGWQLNNDPVIVANLTQYFYQKGHAWIFTSGSLQNYMKVQVYEKPGYDLKLRVKVSGDPDPQHAVIGLNVHQF
ncbi:MAG: hypothetical protein EOP49_10130, partial [Sphingobacteriales bacterium]